MHGDLVAIHGFVLFLEHMDSDFDIKENPAVSM